MALINNLIVFFLPLVPKFIVYLFAKRYIAGPTLEHAINVIKEFNGKKMVATLDILGEEVEQKADSLKVVEEYKQALSEIDSNNLDANISVKPTHLGLKIDKEFCYDNIRTLVLEAKKFNNYVRIDMEDYTCTTDTLEIYSRLHKEFDNVGVVIQAYLRRTIDDVNQLIREKANLRLCKGIYVEPSKIAYKDYNIINNNFQYSLKKLLQNKCFIGIATHDEILIWHALSVIDELKLEKSEYEFQMLLGVTEDLRDMLVENGHHLRIYVPFGEHWYAYSMRRLKENPKVAMYIIKHIFNSK